MSCDNLKPPIPHRRPWFQHGSNSSVNHSTDQQPDGDELSSDDDIDPMEHNEYAESIHCAATEDPYIDYAESAIHCDFNDYDRDEEDENQGTSGYHEQHSFHPAGPFTYQSADLGYDGSTDQIPSLLSPVLPSEQNFDKGPDELSDDGSEDDEGAHPIEALHHLEADDIDMGDVLLPAYTDHLSAPLHPLTAQTEDNMFSQGVAVDWTTVAVDIVDISQPDAESDVEGMAEDVDQQLQLGPEEENQDDDSSTVWSPAPLPAFVAPNASNLSPGNYPLVDFLRSWSYMGARKPKHMGRFPWPQKIVDLSEAPIKQVQYADLAAGRCDIQGIDWDDLRVTRRDARVRRRETYRNYVNQDRPESFDPRFYTPTGDSFFRFRRMDIRRNVHLSHFQLRNVLAATSTTQMFYTGDGVVHRFNPVSGEGRTVMKLPEAPHTQISTLAAAHGVLVAGGFNGEYMLRSTEIDDREGPTTSSDGILTYHQSGITNHVQIFLPRQSSSPRAAFASNDQVFRILDLETKTILSETLFPHAINCTALSPDRRLRVLVGDSNKVLITAAESTSGSNRPEILQQLHGHQDHGFACAWADDGWTLATGFQDRLVCIWDARRLVDSSGRSMPVETIRTEMAGARSLHFSPVGSGKRMLVAAEEADFVNIIDAQTFRTKQTIDIFGEIGGTTFTNDGQDLVVLCTDRVRGGLIQLERCGLGGEASWDPDENPKSLPWGPDVRQRGRTFDWPRNHHNEWKAVRESETKRRRKAAMAETLEPF